MSIKLGMVPDDGGIRVRNNLHSSTMGPSGLSVCRKKIPTRVYLTPFRGLD